MDEGEVPQNKDPEIFGAIFSTVVGIVQLYGWVILLVCVAIVYSYSRLRPRLAQRREETEHKKMDAGAIRNRQEAMERARLKMQAELDSQAEMFAERQKQREEEKRKAKIEDWDRHQEGKGYRSKYRPPEASASTTATSSSQKPKPKKTLKPDYSPLAGDGGGACFRPARKGPSSGGG